ncbi:MAG: hypothetical protein ACD_3C00226G0011 [uncultured bacterium (gcode 4)]|uniref:CYTH domain-containing protein n=1 Tax=uncultured bacterium (gcode 4) TaxID=1234023 RepID=K2FZD6_9BACT|nr:MAG: hypothetical protein ACD_3C00226G0011 [uncultured bacterium (gcode 4)]
MISIIYLSLIIDDFNMEIERKFLIKDLPDLKNINPIRYERHFLFIWNWIEFRIQSKWDIYELERKEKISDLSRDWIKIRISKDEFEVLKWISNKILIRDWYNLSENVSIKIYRWDHEWLKRAEVEFKSEEEAKNFIKPDWMWEEITDSPLWKDSKLIQLDKNGFKEQIDKYHKS